MTVTSPSSSASGGASGRVARTKGVSMLPEELADAATVEQLTGVGFSEVYRRHFAPQMRAAAELLRQAEAAGLGLDRARWHDVWSVRVTAAELDGIYVADSELRLGD